MKKLLLILLCLPFVGIGQACQYGNNIDAAELCDFYKGNNFATYRNADIALNKILEATGMSKRFVLKECNDISNCVATSYKGIRYILYDREFMDAIATRTNSWSSLSILAHEIGHHVNGHSLDLIIYATESAEAPTLAESRQMELEADEYSGFVMFKLGASLQQAQEGVLLVSTNDDDSYSTHPKRDKRLRAIAKGYNKAKGQVSNNDYSTINTINNSSSNLEKKITKEMLNEYYSGRGTYETGYGSIKAKYIGDFVDGERHGQGTLYFIKDRYVGEWKNDQKHGQGTQYYKNYKEKYYKDRYHKPGDKYVGEWKNGYIDGKGTYYFANGDKYVGDFVGGERHGQGTHTYADGRIEKGLFKDDKYVGE